MEEQLYLFMKRFKTQPSEVAKMDKALRIKLYNREYKLIEAENEELERLKNS